MPFMTDPQSCRILHSMRTHRTDMAAFHPGSFQAIQSFKPLHNDWNFAQSLLQRPYLYSLESVCDEQLGSHT
jgi:hypothetical protein